MNDRDEHLLDLDNADLDGHTIEELGDYLDAGRTPFDPSIENSPGCLLALESLTRVRTLSTQLMASDPSPVEASWVASILSGIAVDARAGRRVPLAAPSDEASLAITEGAVRGVIRGAEARFPGVIIGKCQLDGDVTDYGATIGIVVDVAIPFGQRILDVTEQLRDEIAARVHTHTPVQLSAIDIVVHDVIMPTEVTHA